MCSYMVNVIVSYSILFNIVHFLEFLDVTRQYRQRCEQTVLFFTGATECNGNHLTYTATGPLESQGVSKSEFQDIKPGNYFQHKILSHQVYLFTGLWP
jgi:hypothetical protein